MQTPKETAKINEGSYHKEKNRGWEKVEQHIAFCHVLLFKWCACVTLIKIKTNLKM